jgi:hypothetical protein
MDGMVGEQLHAPDLMSAVAGYKVLLMGVDGFLVSPYHRSCQWVKPRMRADCKRHEAFAWTTWGHPQFMKAKKFPDHEAPDVECKCGLYSYHEAKEIENHYTPINIGLSIICLTSSEGRLAVHQKGLRAEWQEIRAVAIDTGHRYFPKDGEKKVFETCRDLTTAYAERWNLPLLMSWKGLPNLAAEMNLHPVPKTLLPDADNPPTKP